MPNSAQISTTNEVQATQTLYNNLVRDATRMLQVAGSGKTISGGVLTVAPGTDGAGYYLVDTEASATEDDLDTINGGQAGDIITLCSVNAARFVRVRSGVGNIRIPNGLYIDLDTVVGLTFRHNGTNWVMDQFIGAGYIVLTNRSGSTVNYGDLVIWATGNPTSFTTTAVAADRRVCGVVKSGSIAAGAAGIIAIGGTIETVKVQGNVVVGQALIASSTVKRAAASGGSKQDGFLGFALTAYSGGGAGTVQAFINPDSFRFSAAIGIGTSTGFEGLSGTVDCTSQSSRCVIVVIRQHCRDENYGEWDSISSVTVGGVAMTQVGSALTYNTNSRISVFRLVAPATGSQSIVVNRSVVGSSDNYFVQAIPLYGVDQTTPVRTLVTATAGNTTPSATASGCVAGDLILGGYVADGAASTGIESSLGTNQQSLRKDLWSGYGLLSISKKDGTGASETMSAVLTSSHSWGAWALGIKPA